MFRVIFRQLNLSLRRRLFTKRPMVLRFMGSYSKPRAALERSRQSFTFMVDHRDRCLLGWHYSDYYTNAYALNQYLASRGYVVLSVNYRLGIGYGHDFHRPPECRRAGRV